jgi:DNA-binding NarL/FixJ family response regulator
MKEITNGTHSNGRTLPLKVAIVGKRKLDIIGIYSILDSVDNVLIVEQFQIDELSAFNIPRLQADVLLWCLLNITPASVTSLQKLIQKHNSIIHALIVTHINARILRSLINSGCNICIAQDDVEVDLPLALQHIMKSQRYISSSLVMEPCFPPYILDKGNIILEERELIISKLLAQGYRNRDIATEVGLTVKSVERHLTQLYSKLHVRSRAEAVAIITQEGLLFD